MVYPSQMQGRQNPNNPSQNPDEPQDRPDKGRPIDPSKQNERGPLDKDKKWEKS